MKIGERGIRLIQAYEECRLKAYLPTPNDKWTIGWGHTGPDVTEGTVWTQEHADQIFLEDIAWVEDCINENVTVPLIQPEYDAICSLVFRIGCPNFKTSTILKKINALAMDEAAMQFASWNKQRDKTTGQLVVLNGLTNRAKAEKELFERSA